MKLVLCRFRLEGQLLIQMGIVWTKMAYIYRMRGNHLGVQTRKLVDPVLTNLLTRAHRHPIASKKILLNIEGIPRNACGASGDISLWYLMCMIAK